MKLAKRLTVILVLAGVAFAGGYYFGQRAEMPSVTGRPCVAVASAPASCPAIGDLYDLEIAISGKKMEDAEFANRMIELIENDYENSTSVLAALGLVSEYDHPMIDYYFATHVGSLRPPTDFVPLSTLKGEQCLRTILGWGLRGANAMLNSMYVKELSDRRLEWVAEVFSMIFGKRNQELHDIVQILVSLKKSENENNNVVRSLRDANFDVKNSLIFEKNAARLLELIKQPLPRQDESTSMPVSATAP